MPKEINEASDTHNLKDIVCPYCGEEYPSDDIHMGQDEQTELECPHCEKSFTVTASWDVSYSSERKSCGKGKHEFIMSDHLGHNPYIYSGRNWTIYQCKVCHEEVVLTGPVVADGQPYVQIQEVKP